MRDEIRPFCAAAGSCLLAAAFVSGAAEIERVDVADDLATVEVEPGVLAPEAENASRSDRVAPAPGEPAAEPAAADASESEGAESERSQSSKFKFRLQVHSGMKEGLVCSRNWVTGSHTKRSYCRSEETAEAEEAAAREFLTEAMRRSR